MTQLTFDSIPKFTGAIAISDGTQSIAAEYQDGTFVKAIDLATRLPITSADLTAPIHRIVRKNGRAGMFCDKIDCEHGALNVGGAVLLSQIKRGRFKAVPKNDRAEREAAIKKAKTKRRIKAAISG
jgi:hypothetical protein